MTDLALITLCRQLYADTLPDGHLWRERIIAGQCDTAPKLLAFMDDARGLMAKREVVE